MSNFSLFSPRSLKNHSQEVIYKKYTLLQNYDIQSSDWVNIKELPGFDFTKPLISLGMNISKLCLACG